MKKSVVLTMLAIYVLAIVAVGLLGIQMAVYDEISYVTAIKLVDSKDGDYKVVVDEDAPNVDYIILTYNEGLKFQLYYEVEPIQANRVSVTYDFDLGDNADFIEISSSGVVTVKENKTIYISGYIKAEDGSRIKSRLIRIYIKANSQLS